MPSRESISRIAKFLARATSSERSEAEVAIDHAYKRMVRDGVTLQDLLTLPESELYQHALVKLVEVILAHQTDLSPTAYREAYAAYINLVNNKFKPADTERQSNSQSQEQGSANTEREAQAREYQKRHGYSQSAQSQDKSRAAGQSSSGAGTNKTEASKKGQGSGAASTGWFAKVQAKLPQSLTRIWQLVRPLFERGGIVWFLFHEPTLFFRLLGASVLWGMAFAFVVMTVPALIHVFTNTSPIVDIRLKTLFSGLTALGTIWRMRQFLQSAR